MGFSMSTRGEYRVQFARRQGRGPPLRPSVLFGDALPVDAKVPLGRVTDLADVDRRLGYSIPKVWFPHARPRSAAAQLDAPASRPSALARAQRPLSSEVVKDEYFRFEAHGKYLEVSRQDPNHPLYDGLALAAGSNTQPHSDQSRSRSLSPRRRSNSHEETTVDYWQHWAPGPGVAPGYEGKATSAASPAVKRPRPAGAKARTATTAAPLAGYAYQRSVGSSSARRQAWAEDAMAANSTSAQPKPRVRQRKVREAESVDDEALPPPPVGSVVRKEDLRALADAEATTKAAAKAVAETLLEAKAANRARRLQAVVHAPDLSSQQLKVSGAREHRTYMAGFEAELKTVLAHKQSIQQEMLSSIELQHQALPLRFLFTVPGGPTYCRVRLRRALSYWVAEFEKNQCVVALALWRIAVDRFKFKEATEVYHKGAGSSKLTAIMHKMQLALKARVLRKFAHKVSWCIFEHRNASALIVQRMLRRVKGLERFLWMHDSIPFGGLLADMDMDECRFLTKQVAPRVREDKRKFWRASIRVQTAWRRVVLVRWWHELTATISILQALIRAVPIRKLFRKLKRASVVIEAIVRMALARWPYLKYGHRVRTLQRVIRGHAARLIVYRRALVKARGAKHGLAEPLMIQCLWRAFLAKQCVRALRQRGKVEFLAALRIQYSWYKRQGNFSTFVLLGVLRESDQRERNVKKMVNRLYRRYNAKLVQALWRQHRRWQRLRSALKIQCAWRMYANFVKVGRMRRERWAGRKLLHWAKGCGRRRNRAARKITLWYRKAVPGRFLAHLRSTLAKVEELELVAGRRARHEAAALIQALFHGIWVRLQVRRLTAALRVQRVARGMFGRRRALMVLRHVQRTVSALFVEKLQKEGILREQARRRRVQNSAAQLIQALGRRFIVQCALHRVRLVLREQMVAAMRVQRKFRGHVRVAGAMKDLIVQRRRFLNPFKDLGKATEVLGASLSRASTFYASRDPYAGLGLPTVLRRLGLDDAARALRDKRGASAGSVVVSSLTALRSMDEDALEAAGIVDSAPGPDGRNETVVFRASAARKLIVAFCRVASMTPQARAALPESSPEAAIVADFEVIPEAHRYAIVHKMFEEAYSARFASRAAIFADACRRIELTTHQLRRFLARHNTPALAKEHLNELAQFPEQSEELLRDEKRLLSCLDTLRYAAERIHDLLMPSSYEGGLVRAVVEEVTDIASRAAGFKQLKNLAERRRRRGEAHGDAASLGGPMESDASSPLVRSVAVVEAKLRKLAQVDAAATFVQNVARGYTGRDLLAVERHRVAAARITRSYLEARATNHVRQVWEEDRALEQAEYERSYKAWLKEQEVAEAEAYLLTVPRYGWEEAWPEGALLSVWRRVGDAAFEGETRATPPTYTLEESSMVERLQRFFRAVAAKQLVHGLKRDRAKVAKEKAEQEKWERSANSRDQMITVGITLAVQDRADEAASIEAGVAEDEAAAERGAALVQGMVDADAELVVGFPVEARFGGGDLFYAGTVYQVNPTQYTTPEGLKWYPKNTVGITYDDGDFEPAVPNALVRVIRLFPGSRVEARYGGHPAFFPGKVSGENVRDGRVLSYTIDYDDGETEKAVLRSNIRVPEDARLAFQAKYEAIVTRNTVEKQRRAARAKAKKSALDARASKVQNLLNQFDAAWGSENRRGVSTTVKVNSGGHGAAGAKLKKGHKTQASSVVKASPAADLATMLRTARGVFHESRPAAVVQVSAKYTRMAMRFGWQELTTEDGKAYFLNLETQETSWLRPTFNFKEEHAASLLQAQFRAMAGKKAFQARIQSEGVLQVVAHTVKAASEIAWVGHGQEGVTLELWLNRMGLHKLKDSITKAAHKRAIRLHKPNPDGGAILELLRHASMDELEKEYAIERAVDQRLLMSLRYHEAPAAIEELEFINGYSGPHDTRTMRECIEASRPKLHDRLSAAYKGNPTRVEKMVEELVSSHFPVTQAQLRAFLSEYEGKPAMAQDHVGDLVDVPTTHTGDQERACLEVMKSGARRLIVLASNLGVGMLKKELELVLARADKVLETGVDPGHRTAKQHQLLEAAPSEAPTSSSASLALALGRDGADPSRSGFAAKAALLLRVEVLEASKRWWLGTIKLQTAYRSHLARRAWKVFLKTRSSTALLIQSLFRGHQARLLAAFYRRQQQSMWEELWSEEEGVFYYFNTGNGEALWNPPLVAYRPMVRDRFTQVLMQAWPYLDIAEQAQIADEGMCMRCFVETATRFCNECVPRKPPAWTGGKKFFCFACYAHEHAETAELSKHTFTITKEAVAAQLQCCVCAELATRRCQGPPIGREVYAQVRGFIQAAVTAGGAPEEEGSEELEVPSVKVFREFVFGHALPFSVERCAVLHAECRPADGMLEGHRAVADFWQSFLRVLELMAEECNESYCAKCWCESHRKGRRAKHVWAGFQGGAVVCAMCEKKVAERHCSVCADDLCTACAVATHLRGKKQRHAMAPIREQLAPKGQRYCGVCDLRGGSHECPLCDTPLCDSCLEFKHNECPNKNALIGDSSKPTKCVVCGRPPDTSCVECGDVYCSVKWMGNPGCFVKVHRKGQRKTHTQAPYTYMEDREAARVQAHRAKKLARKELKRKQAEAAAQEKARQDEILRRQNEREQRILAEAYKILEAKKKTKSAWLPLIGARSSKRSSNFLEPIKTALGISAKTGDETKDETKKPDASSS